MINIVANVTLMGVLIVQLIEFKILELAFALSIQYLILLHHIVQVIYFYSLLDCDVAVISGIFSDDLSELIYTFEYDL